MIAKSIDASASSSETEALLTKWHADPAHLSFLEYRSRCINGRPSADGRYPHLDRHLLMQTFSYKVREETNPYTESEDADYGSWTKALEMGRSYLVGDRVPMAKFVREHTSSLTGWQKMAFHWCTANPSRALELESESRRWLLYKIRRRGEYVEIGLPYHDWGGERYWITRDGKRKVLVNVD
jgi:hypothetical protein